MISNAEITEIIEAVNNEEYTITDALNELAKAAKGEDVRRALYATAYVLNKEGHTGTVDIQARAGIENLTTSVNEQITEFESGINSTVSDIQTTVNNIDTTRRALVIDELWSSVGGQGRTNAGIKLSESISGYEYLMFYASQKSALIPSFIFPISRITIGDTRLKIYGIAREDGLMTIRVDSSTKLTITENITYSPTSHSAISYAPDISQGDSGISSIYITITGIYGIKTL